MELLPFSAANPGFDALSLHLSACGHSKLTSIQSCCKTSGNQKNHIHDGTPQRGVVAGLRFHPVIRLRDMSFHVRMPPAWALKSVQCPHDRAVRPGLLLRTCNKKKEWYGFLANDCSHASPSLPFHLEHMARGPTSTGKPSLNGVAILHWPSPWLRRRFCAWPSTSCPFPVHPRLA